MNQKDFISLKDFNREELIALIKLSIQLKKKPAKNQPLKGKSISMIFAKSSTRTRVSFEVGITQLGGKALFLSSQEIQLGRGESITDTGKVLSRYTDGFVIRTYDYNDVKILAECSDKPVINALTDLNHPCQIIADLVTILENASLKNFAEKKIAYIGDGNNIAYSLAVACKIIGIKCVIATPPQYQCKEDLQVYCQNSTVIFTTDPFEAVKDADVIYTDTWISMGEEDAKEQKLRDFQDYQVNSQLVMKAKEDYIFLHCLPAYRGKEVTAKIIDDPLHSKVIDQAENRLHAQKAIMLSLF